MEVVEIIYLVCFFLGLGFAVLTGLLSGVFGGFDAGLDIGGGDAGMDAGGADGGHFSPFNPIVIAMFLASFGGAGIISKNYLELSLGPQLGIASVAGFGIGGAVFWMLIKFFRIAQASSEVKLHDVIGKDAEVTISIPPDGVGQIAYISGGRYTSAATSVDNSDIPQGSQVKIRKIVGTTFYVERIP